MNSQTYLVWRIGGMLKYRVPQGVHEVPLTRDRERELHALLAKWEQEYALELAEKDHYYD